MARKAALPASIKGGIPADPVPPLGWSKVSFGDALEVVERPIALDSEVPYQLVNAKRSRGGIVAREQLLGKEILTKTQFQVAEGDFLISKRQIIHGACGFVPPDLDGAVVSNEYAALRTRHCLVPGYFAALSHSDHFQRCCFHSSVGVDIEKMVFKLDQWLAHEFVLPPIAEQKKIAAILGSVDVAIQATQAVIDQTRMVKQGLQNRLAASADAAARTSYSLGSLIAIIAGTSVNAEDRPKQPGEVGILKISAVTYGVFNPQEHKTIIEGEISRAKVSVKANTILVSRANTTNLVGASVFIEKDDPSLFLPDKLWQVSVADPTSVSVKWLFYFLSSPRMRKRISAMATGTSSSMKNVSMEKFLSLSISLPSLADQERAVERMDAVSEGEYGSVRSFAALQNLKAGLLSNLLTGRVRVSVPA